MELDFNCPENSGNWKDVNWTRGGSDQPLSGIQNKYPPCHDTFDESGTKTGVRTG